PVPKRRCAGAPRCSRGWCSRSAASSIARSFRCAARRSRPRAAIGRRRWLRSVAFSWKPDVTTRRSPSWRSPPSRRPVRPPAPGRAMTRGGASRRAANRRWPRDDISPRRTPTRTARSPQRPTPRRCAFRPARAPTPPRAPSFPVSSRVRRGVPKRRGRRSFSPLPISCAAGATIEVAYWRARATELTGNPQAAVNAYLGVLRLDPYHLVSLGARRRLAGPGLAPSATILAQHLAETGRPADLFGAWLILGDLNPLGRSARTRLAKLLLADRRAAPFLRLSPVPVGRWPLWNQAGNDPSTPGRLRAERMLLSLGLWADGVAAANEAFDPTHPDLAFTAALELARVGQTRRSIALADAVRGRAPAQVPEALLPGALLRLLYPFPYADLLRSEGLRRGIDPLLLAAILREESRFDPSQVRGAERGLAGSMLATQAR